MRGISGLFVSFLLAGAAVASAQEGGVTFRLNCATCHGLEARGNGPMTQVLSVEVPDLTLLAARNGGEFPLMRVIETIDGRNRPLGHGGPMPVFGFSLQGDAEVLVLPDGSEMSVARPIAEIAVWLQGVQR